MQKLVFTLMLLASSLALAGTVYKWVDEDGVVHYSDQPHQNAQKLQVHDVQTYKPSALDTTPTNTGTPAPPNSKPTGYAGCAITEPQDAQDFANVDALNVIVQTDPHLRAGDQIYVTLDGQALNNGAPTGTQFTLSPVDRGSHTLQAVVKGSDGSVLCQTPGISFNVHQTSILNPANPLRPH
jgi:hypothetical protein